MFGIGFKTTVTGSTWIAFCIVWHVQLHESDWDWVVSRVLGIE